MGRASKTTELVGRFWHTLGPDHKPDGHVVFMADNTGHTPGRTYGLARFIPEEVVCDVVDLEVGHMFLPPRRCRIIVTVDVDVLDNGDRRLERNPFITDSEMRDECPADSTPSAPPSGDASPPR